MTEFRRPSPSPLPPDGLAAVVRAGRRRRARLTASGAVAVGIALLTTLTGPAATNSLQPTADPTASASTAPSPAPGPTGPTSPGGSPADGDPTPAASAPEQSGGPTAGPPEPTPSPEPSPSSRAITEEYGRAYPHHNPMRDGVGVIPPGTSSGDATFWLIRPSAERKAVLAGDRPRVTYDLELSMCVATVNTGRTDPEELRYATTQEADVEVVDPAGRVVWRWSRNQSFAADRHVREVRSGQCVWWATEWDGVDDSGHLVPPGTYVARLASTADGWGFAEAAETDVTVS